MDKDTIKKQDESMDQMLIDPYADIPSPLEKKKQIGNSPFQFLSIPLDGKLITEVDGTQIIEMDGERVNEGNFQVLKNMRYGELSPKSIAGMTKINSTSVIHNDTPQVNYLVGWYPIDEGSGTTINNDAPAANANRWPDLSLNGSVTTFWSTLAGFGTFPGADNSQTCYGENLAGVTVTGTGCSAAFCRITTHNAYKFVLSSSTAYGDVGEVNEHFWTKLVDNEVIGIQRTAGNSQASISPLDHLLTNTWAFVFHFNSGGFPYAGVALPDGTLSIGAAGTSFGTTSQAHKYFLIGYGYDSANVTWRYWAGQIADVICYEGVTLTQDEWAQWYDSLRSRYSMSARSGW